MSHSVQAAGSGCRPSPGRPPRSPDTRPPPGPPISVTARSRARSPEPEDCEHPLHSLRPAGATHWQIVAYLAKKPAGHGTRWAISRPGRYLPAQGEGPPLTGTRWGCRSTPDGHRQAPSRLARPYRRAVAGQWAKEEGRQPKHSVPAVPHQPERALSQRRYRCAADSAVTRGTTGRFPASRSSGPKVAERMRHSREGRLQHFGQHVSRKVPSRTARHRPPRSQRAMQCFRPRSRRR